MTVLDYFKEMCAIPHGSGNTAAVSGWLVDFAKQHELRHIQDEIGNVVIYKSGSAGKENDEPVILQAHMDMVCVKENWVEKDFLTEAVDLESDGEWLWAKGTSLGADDGIGAAMILSVLSDDSLAHPPIEAIFTVDEETGMDGARVLDLSIISGKRMINLDHGLDGSITVGCAGGVNAICFVPCVREPLADDDVCYKVSITGLLGGHSGGKIHEGRANASRLLARLLYGLSLKMKLKVCEFNGGTAHNVIPSSAAAVVAVPKASTADFERLAGKHEKLFKLETPIEKNLTLSFEQCDKPENGVTAGESKKLCRMLSSLPDGMRKKMEGFENLARQSSNIGVVRLEKDGLHLTSFIRSPYEEERQEIADLFLEIVQHDGGRVEYADPFPGWEYRKDSKLRETAERLFREKHGKEPIIEMTHGGLEIGFFAEKIAGFDCIAMGPTMTDIHSTSEKLNLKSTEDTYEWLKEILAAI